MGTKPMKILYKDITFKTRCQSITIAFFAWETGRGCGDTVGDGTNFTRTHFGKVCFFTEFHIEFFYESCYNEM